MHQRILRQAQDDSSMICSQRWMSIAFDRDSAYVPSGLSVDHGLDKAFVMGAQWSTPPTFCWARNDSVS